jgi:two-component system chemotaxis response regulator CheB
MRFAFVAIGTSLGGLRATRTILSRLPQDFPLPVALVQHRTPEPEDSLRMLLQESCALRVHEAEDKDTIVPGRVYIAPANYHLLVESGSFALSVDEKVLSARPSIDVLFESVALRYRSAAIGVVLTGASADGAAGAAAIKRAGGSVIVEDPDTAECRTMPEAALRVARPDQILAVELIADALVSLSCER